MATDRNDLLDRPLTARSVVASLLLGRHPPTAPVSLLVRWCALFGISDTSARVALSRMVERGELAASEARYELAGRVRGRQAEQDLAFAPTLVEWDGTWLMVLIPDGRRDAADRVALRDALTRSRLVPWSTGAWVRPDNLGDGFVRAEDRRVIDAQCTWWRGRPDTARDIDLEAALGLVAMRDRGRLLLHRLVAQTTRLPDANALADAFVVGAAAAQHLRRDPLLPPALLPRDWPGDDLRTAYASYVVAIGQAIREWSNPSR